MNDNDVVQLMREPFEHVHAATELSAVVSQGRALRRRRRLARWAGAVALGAVGALAVTLLHSGSPDAVTLAAWTVAERPHHVIVVNIRELRDPERLQRTLRADGVPATVRFNNQNPPRCLFYPGTPRQIFNLTNKIFYSAGALSGAAFTIDTAAIPDHVGLWLTVSPARTVTGNDGMSTVGFNESEALVYASGHCP